jgi:hypothetical protein
MSLAGWKRDASVPSWYPYRFARKLAMPVTRLPCLSPFSKKTNCHVDHNRDYYNLNQELNRHIAPSLATTN